MDQQREMIERYAKLRREKESLEAKLSEINKELRGTEDDPGGLEAKIAQFMEDSDLKTVKYDDLGSVTLKAPTPRPTYAKENEAKVFEYVSAQGAVQIIKSTIHPGTFSAFIKEILAKGETLPEFIEVYYQPSLMYKKPGSDPVKKKEN